MGRGGEHGGGEPRRHGGGKPRRHGGTEIEGESTEGENHGGTEARRSRGRARRGRTTETRRERTTETRRHGDPEKMDCGESMRAGEPTYRRPLVGQRGRGEGFSDREGGWKMRQVASKASCFSRLSVPGYSRVGGCGGWPQRPGEAALSVRTSLHRPHRRWRSGARIRSRLHRR